MPLNLSDRRARFYANFFSRYSAELFSFRIDTNILKLFSWVTAGWVVRAYYLHWCPFLKVRNQGFCWRGRSSDTMLQTHQACPDHVFHLGTSELCLLLTWQWPNFCKRQKNFPCDFVSALHGLVQKLELCCGDICCR